MPTAAEFRGAASSLGGATASIQAMRVGVGGAQGSTGLSGGRVAATLDQRLAAAASDLGALAGLVGATIAELLRRAALCEVYTIEYRAFESRYRRWLIDRREYAAATARGELAFPPGPAPAPPSRPFPEAEVG